MTGGEILGYFKNEEFQGFGAGPGGGQGGGAPLLRYRRKSSMLAFSHVTSNIYK